MAEELGLDIIPVFINGFGKVLPKASFHLNPGHMSLEVMPRIRRDDPEWACNYREMTKRVHQMYKAKNPRVPHSYIQDEE